VVAPKNLKSDRLRGGVLRAITTPLGFYVLSLLIIEATLCLVLTASRLSEEQVWWGFFVMIGLFVLVSCIVTGFVIWNPKNLLYGKEEHREPLLEPSALKDQIEDLIHANVKPECLQETEKNPRLAP